MRMVFCLISLSALVACGVNGSPKPPTSHEQTTPGVTISGDIRVGVLIDD